VNSEESETTRLDARAIVGDATLLATALAAHARLELKDLLGYVLEQVTGWAGAECGFALAPGDERRTWSPLASTVPKQDPRGAGLGSVDPESLREVLLGNPSPVFEGLGPLVSRGNPWPGPPPAASTILPVQDGAGEWAALLVLLGPARPDTEALARIAGLLDLLRPAVANALKLEGLRELVIKDDTAHCFNRRYFESCLPDELARAERFHSALCLIFLDMDNLKEINQRHGHSMGSRTLREVSRRIRLKTRRFDKLFRFGGDEFCVVLPETEWHGALEVAERIRDAIASKPFLVGDVEGTEGVSMTASLGIASFPLHARTKEDLVEQADRAMQRVKRGTKNSIGIAEIAGEPDGS
jgi:diguanylate cyclase (GGDEF)-like protein